MQKKLFAKSGTNAPTVLEHCRDVREAGDAVWNEIENDLWKLAPALPATLPRLRAATELLHDVLKANSSYQSMIAAKGRSADRQPVRHEVLAAVFLAMDSQLANWLAKVVSNEAERWAVIWAVAGHHFKMTDQKREQSQPHFRDAGAAREITLHFQHDDVKMIWEDVAELFGQTQTPRLNNQTFVTHEAELRELVEDYADAADTAWTRLQRDHTTRSLVAVLKSLLAASDAAGSAITERNHRPKEWIPKALGKRVSHADLAPVVERDLNGQKPRLFQQSVAASETSVTVVSAGCGNGKTTAAYLWAQKWAIGKKLFFTYPTTGTATAGYINYLSLQNGLAKDLIHGRSEVDLEAIRANNDSLDKQDQADEQRETEARIDSLRAWTANVVNCTVDTVLGLMQTQRRGVYSFPAFAVGAFVFDEIHAYDSKLWGGLLRFLKEFPGVPALLMSASIPPHRQQQLRSVLGNRMGELITGDIDLEKRQRYRLEKHETTDECWKEVKFALNKEKKKVLWVCNTVGDAIRVAQEAKLHTTVKPILYHSRFRYRDRAGDGKTRKGRQREVVDEFEYYKDGPNKGQRVRSGPSLVIATQVCEMSLDISADLMVTAECPLPSLVQRLGRLNRYATTDDPWPCLVYPFSGLPYNEKREGIDLYGDCIASMAATRAAVDELNGQPCSQMDLADRLKQMNDSEEPEMYSALFDDGWVTQPMPVRDGDQSITVIRTADLPEIASELGADRKKWWAGRLAPWTIPMNLRKGLKYYEWEKAGPYPLAPHDALIYTETEGAQWVVQTAK